MPTRTVSEDSPGRASTEWRRTGPLFYLGGIVWSALALSAALFVSNGAISDFGHHHWLPALGKLALMSALGPVGFWFVAARPRLQLTATDLVIINPLRRRRIPLNRVEPTVEASYYGLLIRYRDANGRTRSLTASILQKANLFVLTRQRRPSDDAAEEINAAVRRVNEL